MKTTSFALATLSLAGFPALASAQWTVTILHPSAVDDSSALWISPAGPQTGSVTIFDSLGNFHYHASAWNGTAGSWENLSPDGASESVIFASHGSQQGGYANMDFGGYRASLWSGTKDSWINLHPPGTGDSQIDAMDGTQQVGFVSVGAGGIPHASLWSGTAASWVDLNPVANPDVLGSRASAVGDGQQGGRTFIAAPGWFVNHASVWSGTPESWVDLNPIGAEHSMVNVVGGGKQGGFVDTDTGERHASLWSGTPESWIDLHPVGPDESFVSILRPGQQIGYVYFGSTLHASLWSGSASSWTDLTPPGATASVIACRRRQLGGWSCNLQRTASCRAMDGHGGLMARLAPLLATWL